MTHSHNTMIDLSIFMYFFFFFEKVLEIVVSQKKYQMSFIFYKIFKFFDQLKLLVPETRKEFYFYTKIQ
jgi:hypothetical protein